MINIDKTQLQSIRTLLEESIRDGLDHIHIDDLAYVIPQLQEMIDEIRECYSEE